MATRFYFPAEGSSAPVVSPAFDSGWEDTASATRLQLIDKRRASTLSTLANTATKPANLNDILDRLANQFVSDVIPPQRIDASCTVSLVLRGAESAATVNAQLAVVVRVVGADGTIRGTLLSNFAVAAEWPPTGSDATRIVAATAVTPVTTQPGDRLVVELGAHLINPNPPGNFYHRYGFSAASDFALTSALTTDLNPWIEFSSDLWQGMPNNYQSVKGGDGLSFGDRVR